MSYRKKTDRFTGEFPLLPQLIATSFGAGFLPLAPGTWGAAVAVLLWLPLYLWSTTAVMFAVTLVAAVVLTFAGIWASNVAERYWGHDPVSACVDETVGQWIAMLPLCVSSPWWLIALSFVLFRAFDIFKPLGIRRLEKIPGGAGMMADDIAAGLYAAVIVGGLNYYLLAM